MHVRIEKGAAWSGVVLILLFVGMFWFIAGLFPPLDPSDSAAETAGFYSQNEMRLRLGLALMILCGALFTPFFAQLARQVRRIEGYWGVMSVSQVMLGVWFPVGLPMVSLFGMVAAYRPDRSPELKQAFNDLFWLTFVGVVGPLVTQVLILAFCVFIDQRATPSFPRWFGYFQIWYAILGVPGCAIYLFHSGPLAWNGLFAFWIPLSAFCIWLLVTAVMLVRAVDVEAAERAANAAELKWEPAA